MSIYNLMTTSIEIEKLANQGASIIKVLKDYLLQNLSDHIKITKETPHSLHLSYFGYQLIIRVEIQMENSMNTGIIAAYHLTYGAEPAEYPLEVEYTYDRLGNINQRMLAIEFSPHFVSEVFIKMCEKGSRLRP